MRISNVCCCELLVTSASVVSGLASVWPRPSHRPGNYWISRPAPLIYLPIISLHLRHVRQSVKIFVDKGPDINLLNLWISCIGVKAEMVKWRRHIFQSLLRLLSNTAYMSAGGVPVSLSPYLRGSEPCLGISWRWHTSHNTGDMQQEWIMGSPNTKQPTHKTAHPTQFNT